MRNSKLCKIAQFYAMNERFLNKTKYVTKRTLKLAIRVRKDSLGDSMKNNRCI